jgi:hypothetical protein
MKIKCNSIFNPGHIFAAGLVVFFYLFSVGTSAQTGSISFSGTWAFNESKSNQGEGGFRMAAKKLVIIQDPNNLSIERTRVRQTGEESIIKEKYTLDGKESTNPVFNEITKKSTVSWSADKKSLTITSKMVFDMNGESTEIKTVEVWKLSDGGKSLTIDSTSSSTRGEQKVTLVYDKQ